MQDKAKLDILRHSTAHLMAMAIKRLFPDVKFGVGPAIDEGFYYDFDLEQRLEPTDLELIEKEMEKISAEKLDFLRIEKNREEARKLFEEKGEKYKIEIINDLPQDIKTVSLYQNGDFIDLCKGPHIKNTVDIKYFKLLNLAGAYWRGDEKNRMLQRIYGTAFFTQEELDKHLKFLEDVKERDHRTLGKKLDLFSISEDIGAGLILWHPKGAIIRHLIESFWKDKHIKAGYELLYTPHIGKSNLWETSGHLGFYNENMYSPINIDEQNYYIKPMNCPFHILVYKNSHHSYKSLPIRYAELGTVYRYERSGVLHGLMRVRGFTQDDAHIICTIEQIENEIISILKFCFEMLNHFGFYDYKIFLSTRPKEKFVGSLHDWEISEKALEKAMELTGFEYEIDEGGGAFYGPKIDIKIKDALGRYWQCSTIQFDFNEAERFDITYIGQNGAKHRPFMIHRALFGSLERFFGILIEHYKGAFPIWLMPEQVRILTINEKQNDYAKKILEDLKKIDIRATLNNSNDKLGYKIREAQLNKIPYMVVLGDKELENNEISVRTRLGKVLEIKKLDEFIRLVLEKNKNHSFDI
ncbi:MAG: threonine--tRNA ligase [Elusimicrobiota bacterium]|nr:threonine--tRNA ligase [Elusimicrobiota bacterium]